ncbi:hypothetical protein [Helicobacter sp. 16-1353]|uniref:hypothetical protein n=1 Tax=Helicobacter sp. 16-1353 TaxID=2004996 RepID=UPI0011BF5E21|nr:hypothetical protein [Helicobacter sp. 16-1353]
MLGFQLWGFRSGFCGRFCVRFRLWILKQIFKPNLAIFKRFRRILNIPPCFKIISLFRIGDEFLRYAK